MKVTNLSFQHHKKAPYFFKDLSFHLQEGHLHALHGKNGVGKSVLLHILSKKIEKDAVISGEISVDKVALVDQRFDQTIADRFTFLENVQFGSLGYFPSPFSRLRTSRKNVLSQKLLSLLEQFHINLSIPAHKLSGGQRQILSLVMQLQREAKIFLLDEPTATCDEENAVMVFDFLQALQGVTLLVVCHDQALISRYTTGKHLHMHMNSQGLREISIT
ncbi:MAG TPA: ATP-binding cassette domain-containing protein [Chlamydiales bacterium]|nr:ATP-binding cassette domain-containing protein [Chlamydiales bacterium]